MIGVTAYEIWNAVGFWIFAKSYEGWEFLLESGCSPETSLCGAGAGTATANP